MKRKPLARQSAQSEPLWKRVPPPRNKLTCTCNFTTTITMKKNVARRDSPRPSVRPNETKRNETKCNEMQKTVDDSKALGRRPTGQTLTVHDSINRGPTRRPLTFVQDESRPRGRRKFLIFQNMKSAVHDPWFTHPLDQKLCSMTSRQTCVFFVR